MTTQPREALLHLGRYVGFEEIASGGMGVVLLGRMRGPVGFSRTVAIKRLHSQYAQQKGFVKAFVDEARLAARIQHPNVVSTLDVVTQDGAVYLVMDYVLGESLRPILKSMEERGERIPLAVTLGIMSQALQGLHAAHEATDERGEPLNIIHRDVSPPNILVGVDGVVRVIDFGVAKANGRLQTTDEGAVKGKFGYITPEHILGEQLDRRADVYSASVVMWEMLTSQRLFTAPDKTQTMFLVTQGAVRRPSKIVADLPRAIEDIVMKGLSLNPVDRFGSAREMAVAIERTEQIATPMQIADWIATLSLDTLTRRRQRVADIESSEYRDPSDARRSVSNLIALSPPSDSDIHKLAPPSYPDILDRTEVASDPPVHVDDTPAIAQDRPAPRTSRAALTAVGAVAIVAVAAVVVLVATRRPEAPPQPVVAASTSPPPTTESIEIVEVPVSAPSTSALPSSSSKPPKKPPPPKKKKFVDDGF